VNTDGLKVREICEQGDVAYHSSGVSFSLTNRYLINQVYEGKKESSDEGEQAWILVDTQTGKQFSGKGEIHCFTANDAAVVVHNKEKITVLSLPKGTDVTETYELKPHEKFSLRIRENRAELVTIDGKHAYPLFDNIQFYQFWNDYLYIYQKGSYKIICYCWKEHAYFQIDISEFLTNAGDFKAEHFDFTIVNGGKNAFLRVLYEIEESLYPDLNTRFNDETYQLLPLIEIVGMKDFRKFEDEVYEKQSSAQQKALPVLYQFVMGLSVTKEELTAKNAVSKTYSQKTIDLIFCGDKDNMIKGLMSPYCLYANKKAMLYTDVLKMTETEIKNSDLPLETYQTYFGMIHDIFINYDSMDTTVEFEEKCQEFYQKYEGAFLRI
jgi:hypothetical protein